MTMNTDRLCQAEQRVTGTTHRSELNGMSLQGILSARSSLVDYRSDVFLPGRKLRTVFPARHISWASIASVSAFKRSLGLAAVSDALVQLLKYGLVGVLEDGSPGVWCSRQTQGRKGA
jgi:hypothetical protein